MSYPLKKVTLLQKECAGIAPAPSSSPKLLQEDLADRIVIAGIYNITTFDPKCQFFLFASPPGTYQLAHYLSV